MTTVVAVYSEKGGVGKTALSSGLVAAAAARGMRVLAVDLDPRHTLTDELGVDSPQFSVNDLLFVDPSDADPADAAELVQDALSPAGEAWPDLVRVLAAERALSHREVDATIGLEHRLARAVRGVDDVDLVVIDVPPRAGGRLAGAALVTATVVVIPATLTLDGFIGAGEAMTTVRHIQRGPNPSLRVAGIVRSITPRPVRQIHRELDRQLAETYPDLLLDARIPHYAVREEARTASVPITGAPGREARTLAAAYGSVLDVLVKES